MLTFIADSVSLRSNIDPADGFLKYEVVMSGIDDATREYLSDVTFRDCHLDGEKALELFQTLSWHLNDLDGEGYGFIARRTVDGNWVVVL
jgi:hypothetical protein